MGDDRDAEIVRLQKELAALREREEDLTDFIENASLGLHWVGADGLILWANRCELDLLGYERDEYIGHHIAEFHADAAVIEDILQRLGNRETLHNYEARLRTKNGSIRQVQISSNVRWNNEDFLHTRCFTRDVTERNRYEQRLRTHHVLGWVLSTASSLEDVSPALLKALGEHFGWCAGFLWIPERDALDCKASWEKNPELALNPTVGTAFASRIWRSGKADWIADLQRDEDFPRSRGAMDGGMRSAFGFPIMAGEDVLGVVEFFADEARVVDEDLLRIAASLGYQIGEFVQRTRAQQQLAEREESYRALAETASDGIVTIDGKGAILFANANAAKLFGYTSAELSGKNLTQIMETGNRHLASGQSIPLTGQHRHGNEIPLEVSFGEYRQGKNRIFVGILRDITERKRLEASMRQAAKLESLGVLAGGIAHDFNNLLTGILGNVSLVMDTLSGDDTLHEALENAMEASERAAHLTKQMLAYSGKGRVLVEPTDISALVRQISALIKSSIPKNVILRLDLGESLPMVEADVAQLQQLVMNLIINGAEAITGDGIGRVLVTTRAQPVGAEFNEQFGAGEIEPGDYVIINVSDNGSGIDDETVTKIFDPFFTTKFTGRGLGLAAALGIVKGHKGALKVFSIRGEGTTFKVFLPASTAVAKRVPEAPAPATRPLGKGTVLVVDDEPSILRVATLSLQRSGYTVVVADNGRTGVERFREMHERISVVILDMTMPIMNGEQAFGHMRSINANVPVILSSGYNEAEAVERFSGKGLAGFLHKPYTASELAEKVHKMSRKG